MKLRNNKGFTLIEIAIVLTIVGLIIGGIWLAASTVFTNNKTQLLSKDMLQVIQNTKTLFAGQGANGTATGTTQSTLVAAGVFPPDMVSSAGTAAAPIIIHPFSSNATTNSFGASAVNSQQLLYVIGAANPNGIPPQACVSLLTTLGSLNNMQKLGIVALGAGTGAAIAANAAGAAATDLTTGGTVAVTAAAASNACTGAGNSNKVSVTFSAI